MRKRRVFIAILPSEDIRQRLEGFGMKFSQIPCRWVKKENIHLTIIPPTYLDENQVSQLIETLKQKASGVQTFVLELERITYGPPGKPSRMVWALGKESKELVDLKNKLEEAMSEAGIPYSHGSRPLKYPHLTLARMFQEEWRRFEPKPEINEPFNFKIPVESIEIMESELKRGGAEYSTLASIYLGK